MSSNKITGWILIFIGIAVIFYSLYSSYNIFTARTEVPEIFPVPISQEKEIEPGDLEAQAEEILERKLNG